MLLCMAIVNAVNKLRLVYIKYTMYNVYIMTVGYGLEHYNTHTTL